VISFIDGKPTVVNSLFVGFYPESAEKVIIWLVRQRVKLLAHPEGIGIFTCYFNGFAGLIINLVSSNPDYIALVVSVEALGKIVCPQAQRPFVPKIYAPAVNCHELCRRIEFVVNLANNAPAPLLKANVGGITIIK
jgi:hypothetical protein